MLLRPWRKRAQQTQEEIREAARLIAEKQHAAAIVLLDRVLVRRSRPPAALFWRGEALRAQEQLEAAIASYEEAYQRDSSATAISFQAAVALAEVHTVLARHQLALHWYQQALALQPYNRDMRWNQFIALCQMTEHEWVDAGDSQQPQLEPRKVGADPSTDPFESEMSPEAAIAAANTAFEARRYDEAIDLYTVARRADGLASQAYFRRARCFYALRAYACAIESIDHYLRLNSDDSAGYYNRGSYYETMSHYREALVNYNRSLELYSGDESARNARERLVTRVRQETTAVDDTSSQRHKVHRPSEPSQVVLYFARRGQLDLAEEELEHAQRLDNIDPIWCISVQGAIHLRRRAVDQAIEQFTEIIHKNPVDPSAFEGYLVLSWIRNDLNLSVKRSVADLPQIATIAPQPIDLDKSTLQWRLAMKEAPTSELKSLVSTINIASEFDRWEERRPSAPATTQLRVGQHATWGQARDIWIETTERQSVGLVVGGSTRYLRPLMRQLIAQDIEAGRGVCVIDCQGQLVHDVLRLIPSKRVDDTLLLDPTDLENPVGFNPLECATKDERLAIVESMPEMLSALLKPRNEQEADYLRGLFRLTISAIYDSASTYTLVEFPKLIQQIVLHQTSTYDLLIHDQLQARLKTLSDALSIPQVRRILGQAQSGFDIYDLVRRSSIILARCSIDPLEEIGSQLLTWLLLLRLSIVVKHFNRLNQSEGATKCPNCRKEVVSGELWCECGASLSAIALLSAPVHWQFYLYEPGILLVANLWSETSAASMSRFGGVIAQHSPTTKELGQWLAHTPDAGLISFRLAGTAGRETARRLQVPSQALERLLAFQAYIRWQADQPAVKFIPTPDRIRPGEDQTVPIRAATRGNYSRDGVVVDSDIMQRWQNYFKEVPSWERDRH